MKNLKYLLSIVGVLFLISCEKNLFEPQPENTPESNFEVFWNTFNTDYAGFEERGVDWQEQYDIYRPAVNANTTDAELADVFKQMLRVLDDGHVSLLLPGKEVFHSNLIIDQEIELDLFDLDLVRTNYLKDNGLENGDGGNIYGWIDQVGYLHCKYIGDNMLAINDVLDHFADAKGLIIDLRHNQGGNFTYAFSEAGRFTDQKRFVFRSKTKNGPGKNEYSDWFSWSLLPESPYFNKPIVLLTDRYTISAGERLTAGLKVLPNVVHLGDTTNGAFSTKMLKELPNGWYFSIATQKMEFVDGKSYEGSGFPPDIYSKNTESEMAAGTDATLELALEQFQ